MFPWLMLAAPIMQKIAADKQAKEQEGVNAREQLYAMRSRLAGQLGSPGYGNQAARAKFMGDEGIEAQRDASNQQFMNGMASAYGAGAFSGAADAGAQSFAGGVGDGLALPAPDDERDGSAFGQPAAGHEETELERWRRNQLGGGWLGGGW